MIKAKMEKAINYQINREIYSAYLYLSMSAYFVNINLKGFASWMRIQVQEELAHAMKLYDYLGERGGRISLAAIENPPREWDSPLKVFEQVYSHEQNVTAMINDLVNLAIAEKDHATNSFLQWFVNEQVEEESSASEVLERLKLAGKDAGGLLMLDNELGNRVFAPPATGQK